MKNHSVTLHIDNSVPPVARKHSRVPFYHRRVVEDELLRLQENDVFESVNVPTQWVSRIVLAPKPKSPSEVCTCEDMREPNKAIMRSRYVCPNIDELITDLNGSSIFLKIDL